MIHAIKRSSCRWLGIGVLACLVSCSGGAGDKSQVGADSSSQSASNQTAQENNPSTDLKIVNEQVKTLLTSDEQLSHHFIAYTQAVIGLKVSDFTALVAEAKGNNQPVLVPAPDLKDLALRSAELKTKLVAELARTIPGLQLNSGFEWNSSRLATAFSAFNELDQDQLTAATQAAIQQGYPEEQVKVDPVNDLAALGEALSFSIAGKAYVVQARWQDEKPAIEIVPAEQFQFSMASKTIPDSYREALKIKYKQLKSGAELSPAEQLNAFWLREQIELVSAKK